MSAASHLALVIRSTADATGIASVSDLARRLGRPRSAIYAYCGGEYRAPAAVVQRTAELLRITVDDARRLLGGMP